MSTLALAVVPDEAEFEQGLRLILLLNLLDAVYTLLWVVTGFASEANPLMAGALALGPQIFVLSKIALVSLSVWMLWQHRALPVARFAAVPAGILYAFVGGQHIGFLGLLGWVNFF